MIEIKNTVGNVVKVYAETFEYEAFDQIKALANYEAYQNCKIRVMPDAHAGKGCVIGTTIQLDGKVTPNLVGVDIGCGMYCVMLKTKEIDFKKLDDVIRKYVPSGTSIHPNAKEIFNYDNLVCGNEIDLSRANASIGTLGGGNHFIEVDWSEKRQAYFLVIHTGSRNLGVQVCKYWQDKAFASLNNMADVRKKIIEDLKSQGRENEIDAALKSIHKPSASKELAHLEGKYFADYINDMKIVQEYANHNRMSIVETIIDKMGWQVQESFTTIHNYIDTDAMILRKGAIRALENEKVIIPMNMRDGSLICIGKGNADWNYSAPHGAGRLMSRSKAKENISMDEFKESMEGIFTTSVSESTIDESPQAYKPMEEIIECIKDTVVIDDIIKPVYNFKA